jgi:hypothetical protein
LKTFKYQAGHDTPPTMTVSELREKLNEYPQDMPVFATWEGVWAYIQPEAFVVEKVHKGGPDLPVDCVVIDVEQYV